MSNEKKILGNEACYAMHVALRKACDSKPTSLMYNLVHLLPSGPWQYFGNLVANQINKSLKITPKVDCLTQAFEEFVNAPVHEEDWWKSKSSAYYAFQLAMEFFDESDWKGMASFLEDA